MIRGAEANEREKKAMNVKLLRKVKKHVMAKPSRLRMGNWISSTNPRFDRLVRVAAGYFDFSDWIEGENNDYGEPSRQKIPDCGTVACIAGWTCALGTRGRLMDGVRYTAQNLLGITSPQADALFYVQNWPTELKQRYIKAKTVRQRAKVAGDMIEHFIKTGE